MKDERIGTRNTPSKGIYLILKGDITAYLEPYGCIPIMTYSDGSFIGEQFFLNELVERDYM